MGTRRLGAVHQRLHPLPAHAIDVDPHVRGGRQGVAQRAGAPDDWVRAGERERERHGRSQLGGGHDALAAVGVHRREPVEGAASRSGLVMEAELAAAQHLDRRAVEQNVAAVGCGAAVDVPRANFVHGVREPREVHASPAL